MNKFRYQNRYRIASNRCKGRDYSDPGKYFVTICTKGKHPWFGEIRKGIMGLNDVGCGVEQCWNCIPIHIPNVRAGVHVVMPDHFHGIVHIESMSRVETPHGASLHWHAGVLGVIVNQFKSACTKHIRRMGFPNFSWQSRYHDRIIRNDDEYTRAADYIRFNPMRHSINRGDVDDFWW